MLSKHQEFLGGRIKLEIRIFLRGIVPAAVFYRHRVDHTSKEQESIDNNMSRPLVLELYMCQTGHNIQGNSKIVTLYVLHEILKKRDTE